MHWVGPDGILLWANQAELDMLGLRWDEYIGHHFAEFHADPATAEDLLHRLINDQPVNEYEARLRCKDNSIKHVMINSSVYREHGKFIHTQCFTRDITDHKQIEDALRESEARFRAILSQATAGIVQKKLDGTLLFVNQAFCDMLGYTSSELVGNQIWDFTHPDDLEMNKRSYHQLTRDRSPFQLEKRLIRKDGSTLWVNVSVSPVVGLDGNLHSAVAVEVDITTRKQAEDELKLLNLKLESQIEQRTLQLKAANQALQRNRLRLIEVQEEERRALTRELHDRVGQSLTALNLNLTILQDQLSGQLTEQVGKRLADCIRLLNDAIPAVRDVMSDLRPTVLDEFGLEAAIRLHVNEFSLRYGIQVEYTKPKLDLPRLDAGTEMTLLRVVQEALINVVKHAQASWVKLSLIRDNSTICLTVEDNGSGFDLLDGPSYLDGHGLNIMRERAEAANGTFAVFSAVGKGTKNLSVN